ncbi:MAG TPA: glycosyltransferase, partial [Defluviitaleaceae bacterium]|nr:glycosyltransferase [Defluviitaleaceae bacterium]
MKIVHVAVTAPYIDGWGYQENLLPLYQLKQGDQITIIASDIVPPYLRGKTFKTGKYINNGVTVIRIPGKKITNTLIISSSFSDLLEQEKPDIIFHHNVNCTSLITVAKYKRKHPECTVFCDNHADYINQSKSFLWRLIYYRLFIRGGLKIYGKYIDKFYGVTPQRCDYIEEVFSIPKEKVDFLPIGADVDFAKLLPSRGVLLSKYGFKETDFIIVSGGKMGKGKGTDVLINVAKELY